jgi:hypothetical protein
VNKGSENKKQVRWMIALLAIALLVGIYDFVDFGSSSANSPSPASTSAGNQQKKPALTETADNGTLDPRLRLDILAASQSKKYESGGRNIFRMEEKPPALAADVRTRPPFGPDPLPTPPPPPPPPMIPLKFYGFASKPTEPKKIFLFDEGEVFVARQGDIVERKYKVIQINNTSVIIEDVLNNNKQTIPLIAK